MYIHVETYKYLTRRAFKADLTLYLRDIEVNCMHRGWSNDASGIDSGALCKRLSPRTTHATTLRTTSPNSGAHPPGYISRLSAMRISG